MSFQYRGFWMPRGSQCLSNGEMNYVNSSQVEPKRSHPWFMDSPEQFVNKKQAIEDVNHRPTMGIPHMNVSSWNNSSGFQSVSGQFTDRLFGSEPVGTVTLADRSDPPSNSGNMNIVQKNLGDQYGNNSSFGLSVSHTIADPSSCLSFGGIRKVKVNEVRDSNSSMSIPTENSYGRANNSSMSMSCAYRKNGFSLGPTYGNGGENNTLMGLAFSKPGRNFISMGQTLNMGDSNFMSMGHNTGTENVLLLGQSFDKPHAKFISMGQPYDKGDSTVMSMPPSYDKGQENLVSMAPTDKAAENFFSIGPSYTREGDNVISVGPRYDKSNCNTTLMGRTKDNQDLNILSAGHNYGKGGTTTISFGGFHGEPGTNPSSGYDLLMGTQNLAQASEEPLLTGTQNRLQASEESGEKVLTQENVDPKVNSDPKANPKTNTKSKNKEPKTAKKAATNTFPSNVKSLLSTGMLDGVTVQYVSWSREKSLKAIIKGTGYQCSCRDCQLTKTLNAYEFERHANCKTKHPNNHIYFENGKTIYAVVQELKNTPQEMLYDALQKVTGSQINQKNFRIWKASYQAATRELQRIFGKEDAAKEVEDAPPLS